MRSRGSAFPAAVRGLRRAGEEEIGKELVVQDDPWVPATPQDAQKQLPAGVERGLGREEVSGYLTNDFTQWVLGKQVAWELKR